MSKRKHRKIKRKSVSARVSPAAAERPTTLYWAYGSNLNHRQMRWRCPAARPFGPLYLKQGLLTFRYFADVEATESVEDVIAGGLWRITPQCERTLDRYEGVEGGHYEKRYLLLEIDGVPHKCLYYRMLHPGVMPPRKEYFEGIRQGYRDFKLDARLLDEALARGWKDKDKSPEVMKRWHRHGRKKLARIADATGQTVN